MVLSLPYIDSHLPCVFPSIKRHACDTIQVRTMGVKLKDKGVYLD